MKGFTFRNLTFMIIISFLVWSSAFESSNARQGKHWRHKKGGSISDSISKKKPKYHGRSNNHHGNAGGGKGKQKPLPPTPQPPPPPPAATTPSHPDKSPSNFFNVLDFGAKGDGKTDDTKAFEAAWANACKKEASTMMVPAKYVFLVGPISFSGPYC